MTIYLARSCHIGWDGLRAMIREDRALEIVGETLHPDQVVHGVGATGPDVVLLAVESPGVVALAQQVRGIAPGRVIVVGDHFEPAVLIGLGLVPVAVCLAWSSLTLAILHAAIAAALTDCLRAGSGELVDAVVGARQHPPHLALTAMEHLVLMALLSEGLTEHEIVLQKHVSHASVDRAIRGLKEKFEVRTLVMLGVRASELGFVAYET